MNTMRFRTWLSEQSTKRVADEVVNIRKSMNASTYPQARAAWKTMLDIAQDVLKVKEAKDATRTRM